MASFPWRAAIARDASHIGLTRVVTRFLAIASLSIMLLHPAEATGNWKVESIPYHNAWISSELPLIPSAGELPLITDISARIKALPGDNYAPFITFAVSESLMLPLCASDTSGTFNTNQDSAITFETSSMFSMSFLNGSTGQLSDIIAPSSTQTLATNSRVQISNGHLKITFSADIYVPNCAILISLTKLKVAAGTACVQSNTYIRATRASQTTISSVSGSSTIFRSLLQPSSVNYIQKFPRVMTAAFSDSRPSRSTRIRLAAQNSFLDSFVVYGCTVVVSVQLPLYFGHRLNTSALTLSVYSSSGGGGSQLKVTNLVFDPITFRLTGSVAPALPFTCVYGRSDFMLDISGFQTPANSSSSNLQLEMSIGTDQYNFFNVLTLFPAIETISHARVSFGSSAATGSLQVIVSFATSIDVPDICGPGDNSNLKQKIVLRIHNAAQLCSSSAQVAVTGRFLSVPKNSLVRIGKVIVAANGDVCEISLHLSSGDAAVSGCTSRELPAPDLPSTPITLAIDGLKIPDSPQPPMPVSIVIDEAAPKGVTQSCDRCAEWPSTPTFSGSVELGSTSVTGYTSTSTTTILLIYLNDIGSISSLDTLSIQIPRGISPSSISSTASSGNSLIVCTGSSLNTTSTEKFNVKSIYPDLVLQWKAGNTQLSSKSIQVTCTSLSTSGSSTLSWNLHFDAHPSYDLTIQKDSATEVRRIRTGYTPGRYKSASMTATLSDKRPAFTSKFTIRTLRGSFTTSLLIPALGFSLTSDVTAACSCVLVPNSSPSVPIPYDSTSCSSPSSTIADLEKSGDFLKISGFVTVAGAGSSRFNTCNFTAKNPSVAGAQGSAVAYIDLVPDVLFSAPSISSIDGVSTTLSRRTLDTVITATITFAHTKQLSANSQIRLSGFCNFATQGSLAVAFEGGIQASAALAGCDITITITSGTLEPPTVGSLVRCIVSSLKTPVLRQARGVVSVSTYSSAAILLDSCTECAFVSELPLFTASITLASTKPGADNVAMSIQMYNVWEPFAPGTTILLAGPSASPAVFPGAWKGPATGFKMSVNGAMCDATVSLFTDGLRIIHSGTVTYASLDIAIQLGPYFTVPRKIMKPLSITVTKFANAALPSESVSSPAVYPEISGNCPAGHTLNPTSMICERCSRFRYNDGTMGACQICPGQEIGDAVVKATKCVSFCTWPFEYEYFSNYDDSGSRCQAKDGGICSQFASDGVEDKECVCGISYNYGGGASSTGYYSNTPPTIGFGSNKPHESCVLVNLNANVPAVATIFCFFIIIFVICIFRLPNKPKSTLKEWVHCKATLIFLAFFPTLDFLSDLVYILTSKFYRIEIFLASVFFFVLPMFMFMRQLMRHRAYIHFYLVKVPKALELKEYDNIPKLVYGFLVHLPFYVVNLPTILPLFLAGHFLYCAKLIPLSNVSNMWLRLYTGRRDHDSKSSIIVHLLQESIFEEIVTESLPQLIIQAINQTYNKEWTTLGLISIFMSSLMALNGVYRFLYFFLIKKIPIKEVPSGLEEHVFDVEDVVLGKYALQLPPPSDNKVVPVKGDMAKFDGSTAHQTVELSSVELQPLISRMDVMEEQNEQNSNNFKRIDEKVDSKFEAIDSRIDGIDAKLAGILQALQAQTTASPAQTPAP